MVPPLEKTLPPPHPAPKTQSFCLPAASVDAGHVLPEQKADTQQGHGQPSAGFHPSPAGGCLVPLMQLQMQDWLCKHKNTTLARLETKPLWFGSAGGNIFFGCAVETQQVPSVLCKISPLDRELITACKCFWAAVPGQNLGPRLACERLQKKKIEILSTVINFMRNAGLKAWQQASRNCQGGSEEMIRGRWKSRKKKKTMYKGKMR